MLSRGRPFRQYIPFMILSAHWSWWFFPRPFPRYGILCHGLCHTTLMDHRESSKRPWSLIVPCNIDHHTRRVPCASRGTKMWNIALVMQLMHSLWHARVCVCVCMCVSCVQVGLFAPHFSELFFFSPGCQQQQHAIHHLIHITTAELPVSKSLGTLSRWRIVIHIQYLPIHFGMKILVVFVFDWFLHLLSLWFIPIMISEETHPVPFVCLDTTERKTLGERHGCFHSLHIVGCRLPWRHLRCSCSSYTN